MSNEVMEHTLAPWRMMPPYSWPVPGRKPGTSTSVTSGMLNASQKRTKRAAFTDALISRQPAENYTQFKQRCENTNFWA